MVLLLLSSRYTVSLCLVMFVVLSVTDGTGLTGHGASGASSRDTLDEFRRGFNTNKADGVTRSDRDGQFKSFDRGQTGQQSSKSSSIATGGLYDGDGPFQASKGASTKGLQDKFERGSLLTDLARDMSENIASQDGMLDTGVKRVTARTATGLNTSVGSLSDARDTYNEERRTRQKKNAHMDQDVTSRGRRVEKFDRGQTDKKAASNAAIGQQSTFGLGGYAGAASHGMNLAELAVTRDRGVMQNNEFDQRKKSVNSNAANDKLHRVSKMATGKTALLTPGHVSAGTSAGTDTMTRRQSGKKHDDVHESSLMKKDNSKQLNSDWTKASKASQVGIGSGLSHGKSMQGHVNGYDKSYGKGATQSAKTKDASATSRQFDDAKSKKSFKSNTVIGA